MHSLRRDYRNFRFIPSLARGMEFTYLLDVVLVVKAEAAAADCANEV